MKRRNFLETGSVLASVLYAGTVSQAAAEETAVKNAPPRIAMILYTIRDFLKTPDDVARSLEKVKKIGYDNLELTNLGTIENAKLIEILKQNELRAVSAHTSWENLVKDPQKVCNQYKELGCTYLALSVTPDEYWNKEGYQKFAKMISEMAAQMKAWGITLGYHNHSYEFVHYDGVTGLEILRSHSDPKSLVFEVDVYWVQHGGADPADWIRKLASRVPMVHMKDMAIVDGKQVYAEVGEGNLNWPSILDACKSSGVAYCTVEQDVCRRDPFESLAISIKHMKAWGLK